MAIKSKGIPRAYDRNIVQDLINVTNAKRIYIQQVINHHNSNKSIATTCIAKYEKTCIAKYEKCIDMLWSDFIAYTQFWHSWKRPQIYRYLLTKLGSVKTR